VADDRVTDPALQAALTGEVIADYVGEWQYAEVLRWCAAHSVRVYDGEPIPAPVLAMWRADLAERRQGRG
jgi:hypothetical protein